MDKASTEPADLTRLFDLVQGDTQAWSELMALFRTTSHGQMSRLAASIASGDRDAVRKEAHALKGSLATVGAKPALDTIAALSSAAMQGRAQEELRVLASQLESQVCAVWAYIDRQGLAPSLAPGGGQI